MAADEEEDYMGDLSQFLPAEDSRSSKKKSFDGKLVRSGQKPRAQNWQEERKVKRERTLIEEDRQTVENLGAAIPQSNIGFKLLKQMGYTPGSSLGKQGSGMSEPVAVEIRRGRGGIGTKDPKIEKIMREKENEERKKRKVEELIQDFGSRQKERWRGKRVIVNYRKAEAALAQLENRDVVEAKEDEEKEEEEEEEEEEEITEEDLLNILMKLRNEFHYCLFCGCQYETMESLESNCPGISEEDH